MIPAATDPSSPTPADQRLIGVVPGPSGLDPTASDQGMGTVFAYVRHLSPDSDLMTVGSLAADGSLTSSEGAVYRKGLISRDAEEVSLVIHQLGYTSGLAAPVGAGPLSDYEARGLVGSHTQTCALNPHLTLTAGMDIDFLEAVSNLVIAQPRLGSPTTFRTPPILPYKWAGNRTTIPTLCSSGSTRSVLFPC